MARLRSNVKWFNANKGFGFISAIDGDEREYFAHFSQINAEGYKELNENDLVDFTAVETEKGWQAEDITVVEYATPATPEQYEDEEA